MSGLLLICFIFLSGSINAAIKPKIIGGQDADIKEFPYLASLRVAGKHFCGGTIVGPRHILTAAHCFTINPDKRVTSPYVDLTVNTGTSSSRMTGDSHRIAGVTLHPQSATKSSLANDIAVIALADEIEFNQSQRKIDLPSQDVVSMASSRIAGWGRIVMTMANTAGKLQKLRMTTLNYTDCQSQQPVPIQKSQLCAYGNRGQGPCFGDSGSPLVIDNKVVGILSWIHNGDCASGIPEIYTNVYEFRDFIESTMAA